MKTNAVFYLMLVVIGAAWGLALPIIKIAVSTGYQPYGILVWQLVATVMLTGSLCIWRRRRFRLSGGHIALYVGASLLGSVLPGYFLYTAAAHLPAGVLAIIIGLVPLFVLPLALIMGFEKLSYLRLAGLGFGAAAVIVLVAPDTSLPDTGKAAFVLVAVLATFCYGLEGNFLAWFNQRRTLQMPDAFQILFGASVVGLVLALPLAWGTGQFINPAKAWGAPEWAIVAMSLLGTLAYSGYIWLIARTGPVFAAQISYLITGFGMVWSMFLLGERYSGWVWLALVLILAGLFLVRPKTGSADA